MSKSTPVSKRRKHTPDEKVDVTADAVECTTVFATHAKPRVVTLPGLKAPIVLLNRDNCNVVATPTTLFLFTTVDQIGRGGKESTTFVECFDVHTGRLVLPYTPLGMRFDPIHDDRSIFCLVDTYLYVLGKRTHSIDCRQCIMRLHPDPREWMFVPCPYLTRPEEDQFGYMYMSRSGALVMCPTIDYYYPTPISTIRITIGTTQVASVAVTTSPNKCKDETIELGRYTPESGFRIKRRSHTRSNDEHDDPIYLCRDGGGRKVCVHYFCHSRVSLPWTTVNDINELATCFGPARTWYDLHNQYMLYMDTDTNVVLLDMKQRMVRHAFFVDTGDAVEDDPPRFYLRPPQADMPRLLFVHVDNMSMLQLGWTGADRNKLFEALQGRVTMVLVALITEYVGDQVMLWSENSNDSMPVPVHCMEGDHALWTYTVDGLFITIVHWDEQTGQCLERVVIEGMLIGPPTVMPNGRPCITLA